VGKQQGGYIVTKKIQHTPGPWEIIRLKGELDEAYWIGPEEHTSIARVEHGAEDEEYGGSKTQLANACLIAAAPQLLALVNKATDILATYIVPDSGITEHEAVNQLLGLFDGPECRAAIGKVTGQTA
jgi:hypothetical protein